MMRWLAKNLVLIAPPALVLGLALALIAHPDRIPTGSGELVKFAPFAVFAVGAAIGWRFNQSNAVIVFMLLAACVATVMFLPPRPFGRPFDAATLRAALAVLVPLNVAALATLTDRGVLTRPGRFRLVAIAMQLLLLAVAMTQAQPALASVLRMKIVPADFIQSGPLGDIGLLAFTAAFLVFVVRLILRGLPRDAGYFGSLTALALAFHQGAKSPPESILFASAGVILLVGVVQDSYRSAFLDELTGLPARRALLVHLQRLGNRFAIAMIDIDHFKKFNDTYGHEVGDHVLRFVGSMLERVTGGGRPFRYGGEEFTVVFAGKTVADARPHLEELRRAIAARSFRLRPRDVSALRRLRSGTFGRKATITVSIGIADHEDTDRTPDDVIRAADSALYRAKSRGRNQVSP